MFVTDLSRRVKSFSATSVVRARVPLGAGSRVLKLVRAGHHNPPDEIHEGVPVEVFAQPWGSTDGSGDDITINDLTDQLGNHLEQALVRIAVDTDQDHHRCLDILNIGFGPNNEEINGSLVVEINTESWDTSLAPVIRLNNPPPPGASEIPPEGSQQPEIPSVNHIAINTLHPELARAAVAETNKAHEMAAQSAPPPNQPPAQNPTQNQPPPAQPAQNPPPPK